MKTPFNACILAFLSLFIFACSSTSEQSSPVSANSEQQVPDYDAAFLSLIDQFEQDPDSISYIKFWNAYLASSQTEDTGPKYEEFSNIKYALENGELGCADVDWRDVTLSNFWSLPPHITAISCYEELGDTEQVRFHESILEFIVNGVVESGDGKNFYSAFEVATWGDAIDIVELSGYELLDEYLIFDERRTRLFYATIVNEPETGLQETLYFENNRFLHKTLGANYPFAGIADALLDSVVESLVEDNTNAKIAKAQAFIQDEDVQQALTYYQMASAEGSYYANYQLGLLCLNSLWESPELDLCIESLISSAERGFADALILLAYYYQNGIGVEADNATFEDLMEVAGQQLSPGLNWLKLSQLHDKYNEEDEGKVALKYLIKSAQLGNLQAQYDLIMDDYSQMKQQDDADSLAVLANLELIAEAGLPEAQAAYAYYLHQSNTDLVMAKDWYEKAAEQGSPYANFRLGKAHEFGSFGEKDPVQAFLHYQQAAIDGHALSQLEVGYYNDQGIAVETNDNLAFAWYLLCAKAHNLICFDNLGIFFRDGTVVQQDSERAVVMFMTAYNGGRVNAAVNLGVLYQYNDPIDMSLAADWYRKACDKGNGKGCTFLGNLLTSEDAAAEDLAQGNLLYEKGCELDHMGGCNNLGISYENARGVEIDYEKAAELYQYSCENGNAMSCSNLGYMYRHGKGLERNINKARELYQKACSGGNEIGCSNYRSTF